MHDELATTWLWLDAAGTVTPRWFCRACAPTGPIGEVTCARCEDGPLLLDDLTLDTTATRDVVAGG